MSDDAFRDMFEASGTPIATADAATLTFRDANPAYCELVGYSVEELRTCTPLDLTVPEDAARELELFGQVKDAERPAYALEKRFIHKSGRIVWASVSVTVFRDAEGNPDTGVCICQDVSERYEAAEQRRRFEAELFQSQKLESLGLLAGGIAHDFNNILVGIIGNAELARQGIDPARAVLLDDVLASAEVAADLCRQMLAYSGGGSLQRSPLDLGAAAASAIRVLDSSKRAVVTLEAEEGCAIEGDLTQMRQLVLNLATNAYESLENPREGVGIRIARRPLTAAEREAALLEGADRGPGPRICLEVVDRGRGFPAGSLQSAFEPFVSTKGQGRGLGLAAVIGIVRSHDAALIIDSSATEGTRVLVAFTPAEITLPRSETSPPPSSPDGPLSILVVDDDRVVRRTIARLLRHAGHTVQSAGSVAEARDALESTAVDAVVTDLTLSDGSGSEIIALARDQGLPALLVTGHSLDQATVDRTGPGEPVQALQKPFSAGELSSALAELMLA